MIDFSDQRRANLSIAQGALTNSKRPEIFVKGVYPTHVIRGRGCFLWDTAGRKYVDFVCGLGSNLLGYAHETITSAVISQMGAGTTLSLSTVLEMEVAERIKGLVPFIDAVKFLKTGTEACMAAIKIARAKTGRRLVLSDGYHGWSDPFVSLTPPAAGVVPDSKSLCVAKLTDFSQITPSVAAVIVEPVVTDWSAERRRYLEQLRAACDRAGALLIYDEVITGWRWPSYTVAQAWGVTPDLICLGKAIGGGLPLSVVGGKYAVMNGSEYFVSSTFAGDQAALAAANSVMALLGGRYSLSRLWEQGAAFLERFNRLWPDAVKIVGYPTRGAFQGDAGVKALLWQEACRAGILLGPSWFYCFPHIDEQEAVLGTLADIMKRIRAGQVELKGEPPRSPFAAQVRGKA